MRLLPNFRSDLYRNTGFMVTRGMLDMGIRIASFRYFTEGLPSKPVHFNYDWYRKPLPIFVSSILTAWLRAPFDIVQKAYLADKKFPKEIQNGYSSYSRTFLALLRKDPIILFRNTLPTFMGSMVETFFVFSIFDFCREFS